MNRSLACICLLMCLAGSTGCRTGAVAVEPETGTDLQIDGAVPDAVMSRLRAEGWDDHVADRLGLWVSVDRQRLVGIQNGRIRWNYVCSTAEKGVGNREGSYQTPTGWHFVDERIGADLPKGAVLVSRRFTGDVWKVGDETTKDLVLSRILWLRGIEDGKNRGPGIDSHDRFIYIHGTPAEHRLGRPASMGCVRLSNEDVIRLFDAVPTGTRVYITEW